MGSSIHAADLTSPVEPLFEAISLCASLNADDLPEDNEDDEAFIDADESGFEQVDDEEEMSEVGRVRSDPLTDARFRPY